MSTGTIKEYFIEEMEIHVQITGERAQKKSQGTD
jgi:hypothetical protein